MGDRVKHFTDLNVWRKGHELFLLLLKDADAAPRTLSAGLVFEQVLRSTGSICANIAEGFNRSRRRYLSSLDIATGEANETENWLYKARDGGLLSPDVARERLAAAIEIEKMLAGLRTSIKAQRDRAEEAEPDYKLWES